jgi:hypothetical protein
MLARDEIVLPKVRKAEQRILRSLPLISVVIASLYLLGYIWRIAYYSRIGVPLAFLEFPFPETLLPQSWCLAIFVVSFLSPLISYRFYDYFVETRRKLIAKSFGVICPLEKLMEFLSQKSDKSEFSTNAEALAKTIEEYAKEPLAKTGKRDKDYFEGLRKRIIEQFPNVTKDLQDSIFSMVFYLTLLDSEERHKVPNSVSDAVGGVLPRGYEVPNKIIWAVSLLYVISGLIFGYYWQILAIVLGNLLGWVTYKVSYIEDRVQYWSILWVCVVVACGVQFADGYLLAGRHLKEGRFPVVVSLTLENNEEKSLFGEPNGYTPMIFLGSFKGRDVIASRGPFDWQNVIVLNEDRVTQMKLVYTKWITEGLERSKREFTELCEQLNALEEERKKLNMLEGNSPP